MKKELSFFLMILVLYPSFMFSQKHMVLRADGKASPNRVFFGGNEVRPLQINKKDTRQYFKVRNNLTELDKILFYKFPSNNGVNFGFYGQDWLVQWFEAPTTMNINRAGFDVSEVESAGLSVGVKLVTVAWTKEQILNTGDYYWGYYEATGNGFNDISAFQDNGDVTGGWVDASNSGQVSPFGADLWSNTGTVVSIEPIPSDSVNTYQWVDMSLLGTIPSVSKGDIVGVAIQNESTNMDHDRVGMFANMGIGIPGFKFYANGRLITGGPFDDELGWWTRRYTWDFALDVTLTGDMAPDINSVDFLTTTLTTEDRTVNANISDTNPSCGAAGVASVNLFYSTNGDTMWTTVAMTGTEPNYSGVIPGQAVGTHLDYYVQATDVAGNSSESRHLSYFIFGAASTNLMVFNGYSSPAGYPQAYYLGQDDFTSYTTVGWDHDVWSYGPLTTELLNNYTNVIYIATKIDSVDTAENDAIRAWLDADAAHNFALFGDEWLGVQTGWIDDSFASGSFFFDILGITNDHNNISFNGSVFVDSSVVHPVAETVLGGPLYNKYNQVSADSNWTSSMLYSPQFEIGVPNRLDGIDFASDVEVDMTADNFDGSATFPILGHRTLAAGNKIVFGSYDPISLDSDVENEIEYYWYGLSFSAPQVSTIIWFGITTDVKKSNDVIPAKITLKQNYPNPFNPSTIIEYSLPKYSFVQLEVYDVVGKQIRSLINKLQNAGNYRVTFDASSNSGGLSSGIYLYRLTANSSAGIFTSVKKMVLLR